MNQGWVQARFGQLEQGIARIREGIAMQQNLANFPSTADGPGKLADALGMTDGLQEGLSLIDEALTQNREWRASLPWLMRIKGDLLLKQQALSEAESCFLDSITVARAQANKLDELVATTHVARLFKSQGRLDEARVTLAGVYGWFTEGFDTAVLKDAKALLDELSD
jgi:hypothetical protein